MTTVVKNVRIMQTCEPFEVLENQDVVVQDDTIAAIGIGVGSGFKADRTIDGSGCTLMPGNVCSHHHYYSGLSRGMLISAGRTSSRSSRNGGGVWTGAWTRRRATTPR